MSTRRFRRVLFLPAVLLIVLAAWVMKHIYSIVDSIYAAAHGGSIGTQVAWLWAIIFAIVAQEIVLGWMERPYTTTTAQTRELNKLKVTVNIPCYNEDPDLLDQALFALSIQTRLPSRIEVVDDGSTVSDYADIRAYWEQNMPPEIRFSWVRTENRGKRHAQVETFERDDADIAITLDSDTVLPRNSIEEGLKPFADPEVWSVAGVELARNINSNLLTRVSGLTHAVWELTSRAAQSKSGDVLVNCGTYALYRASIIRDNVELYLTETFDKRKVTFSDDSLLTLLARQRGKAVQQPTAFQLAAHPDRWSHSIRQRLRWMRGATIRDFWRLRYLRVWSYGWWTVVSKWLQFLLTSLGVLAIAVSAGRYFTWELAGWLVGAQVVMSYLVSLRYFTIRRSDETFTDQCINFALAPVMVARSTLVFRPLRLYSILTLHKTGWGTRSQGVEVGGAAKKRRHRRYKARHRAMIVAGHRLVPAPPALGRQDATVLLPKFTAAGFATAVLKDNDATVEINREYLRIR